MWRRLKSRLKRLSLAQQFLMVNLIVLIIGMTIVGWWIGRQISTGVINYTAATTALYMDSFVAPLVQELAHEDALSIDHANQLERLLQDTELGQKVVSFKIWDPDGQIVYATDPELIGRLFPIGNKLERAWQGDVVSEISHLDDEENILERSIASRLLETYSPIRQQGTNRIVAVAEFYQPLDDLQQEIFSAQAQSWLLVGLALVIMYLLLAGIVKPASDVIIRQEAELRHELERQTELLAQNKELSQRVRRAATRTTALNERFLRRISTELHDGPGQDLGFALLRIEALAESCTDRINAQSNDSVVSKDFAQVQTALESALSEIRTISAGLRLPKIETLSPTETVRRAVRDYERKTNCQVSTTMGCLPDDAPLPVRITLYRVLQEALSNSYRHASGKEQHVQAGWENQSLCVEISDKGAGFDLKMVSNNGHFGLVGMRERVELLGGDFEIDSQPGQGTNVRAKIPLTVPETETF